MNGAIYNSTPWAGDRGQKPVPVLLHRKRAIACRQALFRLPSKNAVRTSSTPTQEGKAHVSTDRWQSAFVVEDRPCIRKPELNLCNNLFQSLLLATMMCVQPAVSAIMQPERDSAHVGYYRHLGTNDIKEIEEVGDRACRFVLVP